MSETKLPDRDTKPETEATPLTFLNPCGRETYEVGSNVAICWTGGPPLPQHVNISLVDHQLNAVVQVVATNHKTYEPVGVVQWVIPVDFAINHTHDYLFYIEDAPRTTWTYGPGFKIT